MANKVGALIKEARTGAGLTQEQLARKIKGISADDIISPVSSPFAIYIIVTPVFSSPFIMAASIGEAPL